jgi:hypothetical protein
VLPAEGTAEGLRGRQPLQILVAEVAAGILEAEVAVLVVLAN